MQAAKNPHRKRKKGLTSNGRTLMRRVISMTRAHYTSFLNILTDLLLVKSNSTYGITSSSWYRSILVTSLQLFSLLWLCYTMLRNARGNVRQTSWPEISTMISKSLSSVRKLMNSSKSMVFRKLIYYASTYLCQSKKTQLNETKLLLIKQFGQL